VRTQAKDKTSAIILLRWLQLPLQPLLSL